MIDFLSTGTLLGLTAGFSPGPLLVLVISETLRHDIKEGIKVSIAPMMVKALDKNVFSAIAFMGSFLFFLVGSKVILAIIVGKSRTFLKGRIYLWIMRMLGILLLLFSLFLFRDGLLLLGVY